MSALSVSTASTASTAWTSSTGAVAPPLQAEDRTFVYAVARRIVRNPTDADDVAQEALWLAHRYRDRFRGDANHRTWLYCIARSAALSALRRERSQRRRVGALARTLAPGASAAAPDVVIEAERLRARIATELEALHPLYREVLEKRVHEGAIEREIADELGLSLATVKIRGFRGRRALRDRLADLHLAA